MDTFDTFLAFSWAMEKDAMALMLDRKIWHGELNGDNAMRFYGRDTSGKSIIAVEYTYTESGGVYTLVGVQSIYLVEEQLS